MGTDELIPPMGVTPGANAMRPPLCAAGFRRLIQATSNTSLSCDCAFPEGTRHKPKSTGAPIATKLAPASSSFLAVVRLVETRLDTIHSIRFFRSEPVTPEPQAMGDCR